MKALLWILGLAGLALGGWRLLGAERGAQGKEPAAGSLYTVERGDLRISVNESGYLKAKNNEDIKPKFKRQATVTWLIEEGTAVEKGDKLAEFDRSELQNQVDDLQAVLIEAKVSLESARAELEIQKREGKAGVESARFALEVAQLKLERYGEGEGPNQLRKLVLAAEKAESEFKRAQDRFEQVPKLHEEGFLTKNEVEEERIRLRETEINAENAHKDLELYQRYTDPMERKQLEADVRDAERLLLNAQEKAVIQEGEREARTTSAEAKVRTTEVRQAKLQEELDAMTISAARAGIVHYGDPARPWMRDQIKVGNPAHPGNTLITLPDLSEMQVLVNVHEAEIDQLEKGQEVLITVEAVKGKVLHGKVTDIGTVASSNWMDQANKTFRVEITMDPSEVLLRAGISAKVEILVETLPGVLQAPIHAVFAEEGEHHCFLPRDGSYEMRRVKIGRNNTHHVEILEGLAAGENVLLFDPRAAGLGGQRGERREPEGSNEAPLTAGPAAALSQ